MNKKTLLKVLALVLTAAVVFTVVHLAVLGNNSPVDTEFTFAVEDGNAILTGASDTLSGAVALPETMSGYTVVGVGDDAFKDCADVTAFFLPDTVKTIGNYAFENCSALAQMILPEGLTSIGEGAFWKCSSLVSVTVPASVERIGSCAFYKCSALKSLIIPGASTPVKGIFNVALDIGQTIAVHNPARDTLDPIDTTVYCYNGTAAYLDAIQDLFSNYVLLDNCMLTEYTVRYVDENDTELAPSVTLTQQPVGIEVAAVAAVVDAEDLDYPDVSVQTLTLGESGNDITFVYPAHEETTTAESTTEEPTTEEPTTEEPTTEEPSTEEPTTEEPTTEEPTTEEPTTEEPTTEEPTTEEPTTEEPTTEEPTTEEATTEEPYVTPSLNTKEGSGATLDRENGLLFGVDPELSDEKIIERYLDLKGNGTLSFSEERPGTGSTLTLYDKDGEVLEEFTLLIYGDLNGDGFINQSDLPIMKAMVIGTIQPTDDPLAYLAANLAAADDEVNFTDRTFLLSIIVGTSEYNQATGELVAVERP